MLVPILLIIEDPKLNSKTLCSIVSAAIDVISHYRHSFIHHTFWLFVYLCFICNLIRSSRKLRFIHELVGILPMENLSDM